MSQKAKPVTVEFLGTLAIAVAFLVYTYALTFNPENANAFTLMFLLLIGGLVLGIGVAGLRFRMFDMRRFFEALLWSALSFAMILIVNRVAPIRLGLSPINETMFAILAGVSEECAFRLGLCNLAFRMSGNRNMFFAIVGSSLAWTSVHIARYGSWGLNVFLIIFAAGCVQGWILLQSRMADGPIFGHMLVNAIAR